MKTPRPLMLVTLGVLIGAGLVAAGAQLGAARAAHAAERLEMGETQYAGSYPLRFIRDTATNTCYLAGVSPSRPAAQGPPVYTITAITQADPVACTIK